MTRPSDPTPRLELAQHREFVHRLATALLGEGHDAEDVAQSSLAAALRHPVGHLRDPRAWLARVVRNASFERIRRDRARRARERDAARDGVDHHTPEAASLALERQARLLRAVDALPPGQRDAIVARYLRGRSVAEASVELRASEEAIRSRTRRGLDALRIALDRDEPGGRWALWLTPLARPRAEALPLPVATATLPAAVTMKKLAALALVFACAPLAWMATREGAGRDPGVDRGAAASQGIDRIAAAGSDGTFAGGGAASNDAPAPLRREIEVDARDDADAVTLEFEGQRPDGSIERGLGGSLRWLDESERTFAIDTGAAALEPARLASLLACADATPREVRLRLGGHLADLDLGELERLEDAAPGSAHVVRAWLLRPIRIHVVDDASGVELTDVHVVGGLRRTKRQLAPKFPEWMDGSFRSLRGDSPVTVEPTVRIGGYWVSAPGYQWGHVEVDHVDGGDHTVRLAAAGTLVARFSHRPAEETRVRIRAYPGVDPRPVEAVAEVDTSVPRPEYELGRFAPGTWTVRAEIGMWYDPPVVLATGTCELHVAERAFVDLDLSDAAELPRAFVSGVVRIDPADAAGARLHATSRGPGGVARVFGDGPLGIELTDRGADRPFRFDLTPGRWELVVHPYEVSQVVDVPPEGVGGVAIEVPALADITVRVEREGDGTPFPVERLRFTTHDRLRLHDHGALGLEDATVDEDDPGTYRLRVPPGRVRLVVFDDTGRGTSHDIDVVAPACERVIRVPTRPGARLRLVTDGRTLPFRHEYRVRVTRLADGREITGSLDRTIEDGVVTIRVDRPGLHQVVVEPPDGFLEPAAIDVEMRSELEDGPVVEIPLVRTR